MALFSYARLDSQRVSCQRRWGGEKSSHAERVSVRLYIIVHSTYTKHRMRLFVRFGMSNIKVANIVANSYVMEYIDVLTRK